MLAALASVSACRSAGEPCTPAQTLCAADSTDTLLTCNNNGKGWSASTCDEGLVCNPDGCGAPLVQMLTTSLPDGAVGADYTATLDAAEGSEPYAYAVSAGELPPGLVLSSEGVIDGVPETTGSYAFTAAVTDAEGTEDSAELSILVEDQGVHILTDAVLPEGEDGFDYSTTLEAAGGTAPYGWVVTSGALPADLQLFADGRIEGVANEVGDFDFTVRVFDNDDNPTTDTKDMTLTIGIAPLTISGDQSYDLLLVTIVVLPVLVPFIPYADSLQARGGLRPYSWTEQPIPSGVQSSLDLVSNNPAAIWGLPSDLTVQPDGHISGWMTDISDAPTISIPFTGITLTGYFFMAEVVDSQNPAESQTGLFLIPTVPIGGP